MNGKQLLARLNELGQLPSVNMILRFGLAIAHPTLLASDMIEHSYEFAKPEEDDFTLVSGDTDYVPVIEKLRRRGFKVDVCFWQHASRELKQAATRFVELDPWLDYLALRRDTR